MEIRFEENSVWITGLAEFGAAHIFENGQTFRFADVGGGVYEGVAFGRFLRVRKQKDEIVLGPATKVEFEEIWRDYFDLSRDYATLFSNCGDEALARSRAYAQGLRVLRQQPFEVLICFILSANNNIGRIRKTVQSICELCGKPFVCEGRAFYTFPTPKALAAVSEEQLRACGCGYRAPYLLRTAKKVAEGFDMQALFAMPYEQAKGALLAFPGVGPKVADCVLL
ncbi:MAG TPA: 8-oxoguanine DNA glycosylase, partial [Clostridiales bacterium]|nr:8-oxoguanine DNA glycosylase [Clostridiales bacterium]